MHRVPSSIAELVAAIRAGAFPDVKERPTFYASHTIPAAEGSEAQGGGAD